MSRPRRPYGPNPPGRLLGTMVKVLAAELSDQGRLSRGKRYWSDDAVIDIVIGHGAVTAEVQGSRPQPYVVTIEASAGAGVPGKREIYCQCTCPDDAGTGADLCKHAVAAFFTLADEISIEPELVDRWRAGRRFGGSQSSVTELPVARSTGRYEYVDADDPDDEEADDDDDEDDEDDDGDGDAGGANIIELRPRIDTEADVISRLLGWPPGATGDSVELPGVTDIDHSRIGPPLVADVLNDALDHLAIRWE